MAGLVSRPNPHNVPSAEVIEKERRVLELRRSGATLDAIAKAVGYSGRNSAHAALRRALGRTLQHPAAELRDLESERLDQVLFAVWPKALKGDPKSVDLVVRISESRRRLFGLDHADKIAERDVALRERQTEFLAISLAWLLTELGRNDEEGRAAVAHMLRELGQATEPKQLEAG